MSEKGIDEELITWNAILDEIKVSSDILVNDLLEGIKYIAAAGVLVTLLGAYVLFIGIRYGHFDDASYIVMLILAPGSNFVLGLYNINKYFQLRTKYRRLYDIQRQMKK
jgi:hypothetical protein